MGGSGEDWHCACVEVRGQHEGTGSLFLPRVSGDRTPVLRFNSKCLYQPQYLSRLVDLFLDPGRPPKFGGKGDEGLR